MIDGVSTRQTSPKMQELYAYATSWTEAFSGKDPLSPRDLASIYARDQIQQLLELTSENYKLVPPSDETDWSRTMLFAAEEGGLGAVFLWWADATVKEPSLISISGGDIKVFLDLAEFLDFLVDGKFPVRGDELYTWFETTRRRLGT